MSIIGDRIKKLREERGISQKEAALEVGVSRQTFSSYESGESELTLTQLSKLAALFGVPLEELAFDTVQTSTGDYNYEKYKQIILNCLEYGGDSTDGKITKTKLAKLAYLSDFAWFYKKLKPMSGLAYRRIQQGPVPDQYFRAIDELYDSGEINIEKKGTAFMIELVERPSTDQLSSDEVRLIKKISTEWKDKSTAEIVRFTHKQLPWKICRQGELIPYELITQEDPENVFL